MNQKSSFLIAFVLGFFVGHYKKIAFKAFKTELRALFTEVLRDEFSGAKEQESNVAYNENSQEFIYNQVAKKEADQNQKHEYNKDFKNQNQYNNTIDREQNSYKRVGLDTTPLSNLKFENKPQEQTLPHKPNHIQSRAAYFEESDKNNKNFPKKAQRESQEQPLVSFDKNIENKYLDNQDKDSYDKDQLLKHSKIKLIDPKNLNTSNDIESPSYESNFDKEQNHEELNRNKRYEDSKTKPSEHIIRDRNTNIKKENNSKEVDLLADIKLKVQKIRNSKEG